MLVAANKPLVAGKVSIERIIPIIPKLAAVSFEY